MDPSDGMWNPLWKEFPDLALGFYHVSLMVASREEAALPARKELRGRRHERARPCQKQGCDRLGQVNRRKGGLSPGLYGDSHLPKRGPQWHLGVKGIQRELQQLLPGQTCVMVTPPGSVVSDDFQEPLTKKDKKAETTITVLTTAAA